MKIELSENQSEITLGQYQEFIKLSERTDLNVYEFSKRKVRIFTGMNYKEVSQMKHDDMTAIIQQIDLALEREVKFQPTFTMNGVEFGFIPNFDDIKAKEYFDLSTYDTKAETLHNLMAILFRPIKYRAGREYEIVNYQGTKEWAEAMKRTPLNIVNGALVFFYNLANELESYTMRYTGEELANQMQQNTLRSGAGMQRFTDWLKVKYGSLIT